ncbi:hypothetical protein Droror1_Dr00008527 [Drosera rotundifolia]
MGDDYPIPKFNLGNPSSKMPSMGVRGISPGSCSWTDLVDKEEILMRTGTKSFAKAMVGESLRNRAVMNGMRLDSMNRREEEVVITLEDVEDEVRYWKKTH